MNWLKSKVSGQPDVPPEMSDLAKYAKDPKHFEEYVKMRQDPNDQEFKKHLAKIKRVAESKKNMQIDMRPRVLVKTMTGEVILGLMSIMAVIAMPVYFLKIRPVQLEGVEEKRKLRREEWIRDDEIE